MTENAEVLVELATVLNDLGFAQTSSGYRFEIDGVEFDIVWDGLGRYCLTGSVVGPRTASFVQYSMPHKVASRELALALLAYALRDVRFKSPPAWLEEGNGLSHTLPWNARSRAYEQRPRCVVERDWLRLAAAKLRSAAELADETSRTEVSFNGEALRFSTEGQALNLSADGTAWPEVVTVHTIRLRALPKRWMSPLIEVSVVEKHLRFDRLAIRLLTSLGPQQP